MKPQSGWQYVAVPLAKYSHNTKIKDISIKNTFDWRNKIFSQLEHYKKRAPFYQSTVDTLRNALDIDTENIVKLNEHVLKVICSYIGVELNVDIFSEMNLSIEEVNAPDEWALNICKSLGEVEEYCNPEGGLEFFDRKKYEKAGFNINFLKMNLPRYPQRRPDFEAGLSIIDVMMFNESSKINKMLDEYELL